MTDAADARTPSWGVTVFDLFLGHAPRWYKIALLVALAANPLILAAFGPFVGGWVLLAEFIATLALALQCYPLQPGGLLALQAMVLHLATPAQVAHEVEANFAVILLLMFMVAGIHFLRDLLLFVFTGLLLRVRSKPVLGLAFCSASALLSAFLDALTVVAVVITVAAGFYAIHHRVASGRHGDDDHDCEDDALIPEPQRDDLERFRGFLRSLVMHAAVGTALGGVCTLVGEPQNLVVGEAAGWDFVTFATKMAPVTLPVLLAGLVSCVLLERLRWFGYGERMPGAVRAVLAAHVARERARRTRRDVVRLCMQGFAASVLVIGLLLHLAEVGLIGLTVIVLATALCGIVDERRIGPAFEEALPFTALLVTFYAIVAVIQQQGLFTPIITWVLDADGRSQLLAMFAANGVLSAVSDNVFVATIYITELQRALAADVITGERFELLAVAINTGTNIPSIATPNGQAAFLFLLTSALAPLIRLGYGRMLWMALPYTVVLSLTGLAAVGWLLG